ncbi:hypothetical protein FKM82_024377, partial [Ascaphus truei]
PTVHFAEETLVHCDREDGEDGGGRVSPVERQRLIRKDTPHYKKHFKITKLPKPEAVVALLQGLSTPLLPEDEEGERGGFARHSQQADEDQEEGEELDREWESEEAREERFNSQQNVKGIFISRVAEEGPAARAGVRVGDKLLEV